MKTLPITCATTNMDGKPILITKGESGYMLMDKLFDPDAFNRVFDIDDEVINLMIAGSMFGWDIAAITNYEATEVK